MTIVSCRRRDNRVMKAQTVAIKRPYPLSRSRIHGDKALVAQLLLEM
jgi:hypothetical protein